MIECKECACLPVCKEVDNYKEYKDQYLKLRNKSSLFDEDPKCPYYINKLKIIHNKDIEKECTCSNLKDNGQEESKKDTPKKYIELKLTNEDLIAALIEMSMISGIGHSSKTRETKDN